MEVLKNSDIGLMRGFAGRETPRFMMLMIRPWDSGY
jgi:S-adenosylmethionine synthetase